MESAFVAATLSATGLGPGLHRVRDLPRVTLAALEMAINEESERSAMRGDLAAVAVEHQSARTIAAVSARHG
jgi:hypothetical protein